MTGFRFAELTDLEEIVRIYNSTIPSRLVTADLEPVSVSSKVGWFNKHTRNKRPLWVITIDDNVVGYLGVLPFHERCAYDTTVEVSIYLDEAARGHGLGRVSIDFIESKAEELGIETVIGLIFEHNTPSVTLFEKCGYKEWGFYPNIANLDGVKRGLKVFGKSLV